MEYRCLQLTQSLQSATIIALFSLIIRSGLQRQTLEKYLLKFRTDPILDHCYSYHLPSNEKFVLLADDTAVVPGQDLTEQWIGIDESMFAIPDWFTRNSLRLNVEKIQFRRFSKLRSFDLRRFSKVKATIRYRAYVGLILSCFESVCCPKAMSLGPLIYFRTLF